MLAPWAYIASVLYHDIVLVSDAPGRMCTSILHSDWGRLFHNWEKRSPPDDLTPAGPTSATTRPTSTATRCG